MLVSYICGQKQQLSSRLAFQCIFSYRARDLLTMRGPRCLCQIRPVVRISKRFHFPVSSFVAFIIYRFCDPTRPGRLRPLLTNCYDMNFLLLLCNAFGCKNSVTFQQSLWSRFLLLARFSYGKPACPASRLSRESDPVEVRRPLSGEVVPGNDSV